MLYVSALCIRADVRPIIHFHPYPLQHVTIDFHDDSDDPSSQLRQFLLQRQ
jgi:hypothetical protein